MENYDDYAVNPQMFETMAKEYQVQSLSKMQNVTIKELDKELIKSLFNKIEYLQALINTLKQHTKNANIILVIDETLNLLDSQQHVLINLFDGGIATQSVGEDDFRMFCNNLKIAINTTSDIIKLLIEIKDNELVNFEKKEKLTMVINEFLDINNNLVSLFGECRYLQY